MQVDVSGVDISKRGQTKQKSESPQRKALHCHPPRSVAGILHLMASLFVHSSPSFRIFGRAFLCDFLDKQTNYIAHDGCRVFALLESIQVNLVFCCFVFFGKSAISWFSYYHLILLIRKRHALTAKHFH